MLSKWQTRAILAVVGIGSALGAVAASAQATTATQVLDRVNAVSPKAVLDMAFDDPGIHDLPADGQARPVLPRPEPEWRARPVGAPLGSRLQG